MQQYLIDNWVEITGAVLSLIYLYLSIREKAGLWIFGFFASLLYIWVFYQSKLYAEISLQFYYLFVSVYGWISWQQKSETTQSKVLQITTLSKNQYIPYFLGTIGVFLIYYVVLRFLTDSPVPVADSVVGSLSIIATWMLARKKIENWLVWILADAFACGLYFYKGLYPTAILFVVYTVMAVVGYFQWKSNRTA
jgi:nicotinamide mononucleotide transporter